MARVLGVVFVVLLLGCSVAERSHIKLRKATGGNPVDEVITLLEDLQTQTQDEGKEEAKTYDEFACFCKDTTKEKSQAIEDDQTDIDTHTATLVEKTTLKADLEQQIRDIHKLIETINSEMADAQSTRDAAKTRYEVMAADMAKAVTSIEGAKAAVEAAMPSSFAQVKKAIKTSLQLANMELSPKHQRVLAAFLQEEPDMEVPETDVVNHSGDLVDTMDHLDEAYHGKQDDVEDEEAKAVKAHNEYMQAKTDQKETAESDLDKRTEELEECEEDIGTAKEDLSTAKSKLLDDEQYLKDLTAKCELKARTWDQRSKMREGELAAVAKALAIITDTVKEKDVVNEREFLQKAGGDGADAAQAVSDADQAGDDAEEDDDMSFLQRSEQPTRKIGSLLKHAVKVAVTAKVHMSAREAHNAAKEKVIDLLKGKGFALKSPILTSMAMKVAADPFVKVKSLIQDLIAKLIEEAADESTQKGWCDMETGKAESERNNEHVWTEKLNAQIEKLEATRDKLAEDVENLTDEIAELNESMSKMTNQRAEEKEENMATLQTAKEGHDAVNEAIGVLEKFYKGSAKGKVSLLEQRGVDDDAPETVTGANTGNQEAASGILGTLAVIKSDFENTIKTVKGNEYDAERAFAEFTTTTKGSLSSKETEKGQKEADHTNTVAAIKQALEDLKTHQKLLDDALEQLAAIKPACVDTGDTHEDRVKKREDEIAALKSSLCILDTDGAEDKEC